jgi:hypothetical protein
MGAARLSTIITVVRYCSKLELILGLRLELRMV